MTSIDFFIIAFFLSQTVGRNKACLMPTTDDAKHNLRDVNETRTSGKMFKLFLRAAKRTRTPLFLHLALYQFPPQFAERPFHFAKFCHDDNGCACIPPAMKLFAPGCHQ
jgi:hypothetical protein